METRPLGRGGAPVPVLGLCPGEGDARDAVVRRALDLGAALFWSAVPVPGASTLSQGEGHAVLRYNLLDQKEGNAGIRRLAEAGKGIVAAHVLAGGLVADPAHPQVAPLKDLARGGRTLVQAAIQFVLANESVSCAIVRVSRPEHVDEVLGALEAEPLNGRDLELIFETWANRFG